MTGRAIPPGLRLACAVSAVVLAGCAGQPAREPAPDGTQAPSAPVGPPAAPRPDADVTAHHRLLEAADVALAAGDYASALALLERAQRIAPDDGLVYLHLARAYRALGDARRAKTAAERGLLYCDTTRLCEDLRRLSR